MNISQLVPTTERMLAICTQRREGKALVIGGLFIRDTCGQRYGEQRGSLFLNGAAACVNPAGKTTPSTFII
jgi:hypothetical protein